MKRFSKLFGKPGAKAPLLIIALAAVIVFSMLSCDNGSGGGGAPYSGGGAPIAITIINNTAEAITAVRIMDANGDAQIYSGAIGIAAGGGPGSLTISLPSVYGFGFGYIQIYVTFESSGEKWVESPMVTGGEPSTCTIDTIPGSY